MRPTPRLLIALGLILALAGMLTSLYFSDVVGYAPCILCWYQRICLYPLVAIFTVALIRKDTSVHWYALPLALIGLFISVYHNTIYYIARYTPANTITACDIHGVSCTSRYIEWFGFITIPFLSFLAFLAILILMVWHYNITRSAATPPRSNDSRE